MRTANNYWVMGFSKWKFFKFKVKTEQCNGLIYFE